MKIEELFTDTRTLEIDWDALLAMPEFIRLSESGDALGRARAVSEKAAELASAHIWEEDDTPYLPMVCVAAAVFRETGERGEAAARELLRYGTSMPVREYVCWLVRNRFSPGESKGDVARLVVLRRQRSGLLPCLAILREACCRVERENGETPAGAYTDVDGALSAAAKKEGRLLRLVERAGNRAGTFNELALALENNSLARFTGDVPAPRGPQFDVYVMIGLPGSGKSGYAARLAELGAAAQGKGKPAVISMDRIRSEHPGLSEKSACEMLVSEFRRACERECPVIVDDANLTRRRRMALKRGARGHNARFRFVFMDTREETCRERCGEHADIVAAAALEFEYPQPDEYDILETVFDGKSMFNGGTLYDTASGGCWNPPCNPIVDGRLVEGITFAARLRSFIEGVQPACAIDDEEKEYLLRVAGDLLAYQTATATDPGETEYLARLGLLEQRGTHYL